MCNGHIDMDLLLQGVVENYGFAKEIMNVTPSVPVHSVGVFLQSLGKQLEDTQKHKFRLLKTRVSYTKNKLWCPLNHSVTPFFSLTG